MPNSHDIPWKRIAVEGVAIVISILLAFAIDAGWEERRERIEEAEILLGLQSEFSRYRDDLAISIEIHDKARLTTSELVVATRRGSWTSTALDIDEAIANLGDPKSHDYGGGVLDALISSGRLELVSDNELRRQLATWSEVFNEVRDDEDRNIAFIQSHLIPLMLRWHIPQSRGMEICCKWVEWPIPIESITDDPDRLSQLLIDPEFAVLVDLRHTDLAHIALEYDHALEAMDKLLEMIDDSLAGAD